MKSLMLYMFLFKDNLFNMYYQFINIEFMANSTITGAWKKLL